MIKSQLSIFQMQNEMRLKTKKEKHTLPNRFQSDFWL